MNVRPRILIVDDEPDILSLFQDILSEEYAIKTCTNVLEAKNALSEQPYQLVITDIAMPGGLGTELIDYVRSAKFKMPILIISGLLEIENFHRENTYWLSKPFRRKDLLDKVSSLLKTGAQ